MKKIVTYLFIVIIVVISTVFLLKNNDLYEPIYQVQKVGQDTIYDKYYPKNFTTIK